VNEFRFPHTARAFSSEYWSASQLFLPPHSWLSFGGGSRTQLKTAWREGSQMGLVSFENRHSPRITLERRRRWVWRVGVGATVVSSAGYGQASDTYRRRRNLVAPSLTGRRPELVIVAIIVLVDDKVHGGWCGRQRSARLNDGFVHSCEARVGRKGRPGWFITEGYIHVRQGDILPSGGRVH
jgi:hypothetical protein